MTQINRGAIQGLLYVYDSTASTWVPDTGGGGTGGGSIAISAGTNSSLLTNLTFANSNGVSFGLNGSTITASVAVTAGGQRLSYTQNMPLQEAGVMLVGNILSTGATAATAAANPFGSSLSLQRLYVPAEMSLTEVDLAFGIAFPATNQGQGSLSQSLIVYSFGNSTSLASVLSASRSASWASGTTTAGTSSSLQQGWSGPNVQPFTFAASQLPAGEYAVAHLMQWAAESTSWAISVYGVQAPTTVSASAVTNLTSASLAAAASFNTGSSALTAFTALPTAANVLGSGGLLAASALTASGSAAITAFSGAPATSPVFLTITGTSVALAGASAFSASTSAGITAFSAAPTSAPAFATANGLNPALLGVSAITGTTASTITAWTAAPGTSPVFATITGTSVALIGASAHTGSTSTALTAFTATPTAASVMSSSGLAAASGITGVSSYASQFYALSVTSPVVSFAISNTILQASSSTGTATALISMSSSGTAKTNTFQLVGNSSNSNIVSSIGTVAGSIHTFSGSNNVLSNAGTAGLSLLSGAGLLAGSFLTASGAVSAFTNAGTASVAGLAVTLGAGSFMTASSIVGVLSNAGTGASAFLSSGGLVAGSHMTASGSTGAYVGGTGASSFLSTNGLLAGSFLTSSASNAVLANAGTAGAALAASFTTAAVNALTAAAVATGASTLLTVTAPSFGYNGSQAMTTATSDASYLSGLFQAGIFRTGAAPTSIDLRSTAATVTGSVALLQPWFAFCGS